MYAPGQNLVYAFAMGMYTCQCPTEREGDRLRFLAWRSGAVTSSGRRSWTVLIVALDHPLRQIVGQEAAAALLAQARVEAIPGEGPFLCFSCH